MVLQSPEKNTATFINGSYDLLDALKTGIAKDILAAACSYSVSAYHADLYQFYHLHLPSVIRHAVTHRQADFLAGPEDAWGQVLTRMLLL
jgi:hypothetical protein